LWLKTLASAYQPHSFSLRLPPDTMPRTGTDCLVQGERNMEGQKHFEGRRGGRNGDRSATNVATPSRGGRTGERRERTCTALEELMRKRGVDDAWTALEEMQQQGVPTDKYTVSRMLMKTVGDGRTRLNASRVYRGIGLVEKFIELQPKDVDEVLLNALLDTCCRLKDLNRLESIMQRMRDLEITPSPVTLGILVKTYGQAGDIQKVLQVWTEMEKQRGQANAVTYGCMIDACVKCNHLDKAVEIFKGMRETGKHRNTILYTTLIKGYGLGKDLKSALELFREMPLENVPYNTITYNSIIDACVKSGDLTTAENLLHEITSPSNPLEPDLITFSTLLKGYCHAGDLDKALQLVDCIKQRNLRCDELVYNTLMDGCVKANDVQAGVGLFEEMVKNGMRPSGITHSILARLYQRAGYEDDANEAVAQLYHHHGIERPTGGDRGKTVGRRDGRTNRPNHASPNHSPMSGYGYQDRNDNCWNSWGEHHGYDGYGDASAASTPCGSPMHQTGGQGNGLYLPMDATRGMPPPLPGMGGSDTPYSGSCTPIGSCTPMGSAYGSFSVSPCMSPAGMDHHQGQGAIMNFPGSLGSPGGQIPCHGAMMAPSPTGMPAMPAWPFAGAAPGVPQGNHGMDAAMAQFYSVQTSVPMMQPAPGSMPGTPVNQMGNMIQVSNPAMNGMMQSDGNATPGGAHQAWSAQPMAPQQSPFPMPLSAPHDLAQSCAPSQSQQAFFEMMPGGGQVSNGAEAGLCSQNPFCL